MGKSKGFMGRVLVDGLSGMALGLFSTLIFGTIIKQIGTLLGGELGNLIYLVGVLAVALTAPGIGVGVAAKFNQSTLIVVQAAVSGLVGGYATQILAGTLIVEGSPHIVGGGEPLGAFLAALVSISLAQIIAGRTKLDILLVPIVGITAGTITGLVVAPPITRIMTQFGSWVNWATEQHPFIMGVLVAVIMGMFLTMPISSAAIGIMLNLSGLAAGAATVGCCCNMVGFAVASYRENKFAGLISQGIGTSMLQVPNIIKRPLIWLPAIISSAILGPVATILMKMTNNAAGSGMGSAGLVGQITTWQTMVNSSNSVEVALKIVFMHFIFPAALALFISEGMRKAKWIKSGDMRLEID